MGKTSNNLGSKQWPIHHKHNQKKKTKAMDQTKLKKKLSKIISKETNTSELINSIASANAAKPDDKSNMPIKQLSTPSNAAESVAKGKLPTKANKVMVIEESDTVKTIKKRKESGHEAFDRISEKNKNIHFVPKKSDERKKKSVEFAKLDVKSAKQSASSSSTKLTKSANIQQKVNKSKNKQQTNKNKKESVPTEKSKNNIKAVNGFVETNIEDVELNKIVDQKLKEKKKKLEEALGIDTTLPIEKMDKKKETGPPIVVHSVAASLLNAETNSESEDDSYIDKFFKGSDSDEFNENRVYSIDEIEAQKENGFLSMDSETDEVSDASTVSERKSTSPQVSDISVDSQHKDPKSTSPKSNTNSKKSISPNNKLTHYNGNGTDSSCDDASWAWETSDDDSNNEEYAFDYYYSTSNDSDYSGEEVNSDDYSYEIESFTSDSNDSMSNSDDSSSVIDNTNGSIEEHMDYDYNSEESESYQDSDSDANDNYDEFMNGHGDHDSSDTDYMDSDYDDLHISQGSAISYKIADSRIKIFENDTESRIMELPKSDTEDENCAELISIDVNKKEFLLSEQHKINARKTQSLKLKLEEKRKHLEYEKSVEEFFSLDKPKITQTTRQETPVIINCLKGSLRVGNSLDDFSSNEECSSEYNESLDLALTVAPANKSIITSVPITLIEENEMEVDDESFQSTESDDLQSADNEPTNFLETNHSADNIIPAKSNRSLPRGQVNKGKPKFFNSINSRHVLLLLRNILYFHGNLHVKLIAGNAQVFGYELTLNKTVTIHSPRGHSLIYLIPATKVTNPNRNFVPTLNKLKSNFFMQDIDFLLEEFDDKTDAIMLLERDTTNKGVNMIERYMRETMFPNINAFNSESPQYSSEFILHCKFSFRPRTGLILNPAWSSVKLQNRTKLVTIGGKGVGKSTFVRYTINSSFEKFNRFLFIDLDIGQPELFLPQTISATLLTEPILGPGYLKSKSPAKAILFGDINVLPDPIKYLRCVLELHKFCSSNEDYKNIPWVINTMGYSRGFGIEIMACILKIFQPTDLVQIQSESHADNFDRIVVDSEVNSFKFNVFVREMQNVQGKCHYQTHVFDAFQGNDMGQQKQVDLTAKDLRYAMILSKLGNCLKCNSDWLTSVKPFEVSLCDLEIVITSGEEINPANYLDVLNANLVYLCQKRNDYANDIFDCYGIGIVRSVDTLTDKLYLISTIPLDELRNVNVLAIGAIPLPSAVLLNQHSQVRGAVPYVYNSDNFIGSKQVVKHIYRADNRMNKPIELIEH